MRYRRARTLVLTYYPGQIGVHNFLTMQRFSCSAECLEFLSALDDWHTPQEIQRLFPDMDADYLMAQLTELSGFGAVLIEGTRVATRDDQFRSNWGWGMMGAFYHFATLDTPVPSEAEAREFTDSRRARTEQQPNLFMDNSGFEQVRKLPSTDLNREPFSTMARRRSCARYSSAQIGLEELSDCLYAGNGITGFKEDPYYGRLPIKITPSCGSLNPFELYVVVRGVKALDPGLYHYSASDHDLGLVSLDTIPSGEIIPGHDWFDEAAAVVFLVANLDRMMWKYRLAVAYRYLLMEAGFIGQNIALAAAHYGLSAVATASLKQSSIESIFGLESIKTSAVLAIAIGKSA